MVFDLSEFGSWCSSYYLGSCCFLIPLLYITWYVLFLCVTCYLMLVFVLRSLVYDICSLLVGLLYSVPCSVYYVILVGGYL